MLYSLFVSFEQCPARDINNLTPSYYAASKPSDCLFDFEFNFNR